jgi:hypothetical protein
VARVPIAEPNAPASSPPSAIVLVETTEELADTRPSSSGGQ